MLQLRMFQVHRSYKFWVITKHTFPFLQKSLANEEPENDVIKSNHRKNIRKRETGYYIGSDQKLVHFNKNMTTFIIYGFRQANFGTFPHPQ